MLPDRMVTKDQLLIEIKTNLRLSSALKKHMFLKKDDSGRAMFGSFLNHA